MGDVLAEELLDKIAVASGHDLDDPVVVVDAPTCLFRRVDAVDEVVQRPAPTSEPQHVTRGVLRSPRELRKTELPHQRIERVLPIEAFDSGEDGFGLLPADDLLRGSQELCADALSVR